VGAVAANLPIYAVALPLQPADLLDAQGVPFQVSGAGERRYQPLSVAEHGLALWNRGLVTSDQFQRGAFLAQASWISGQLTLLVSRAQDADNVLAEDAESLPEVWLSARALGASASLLTRAYLLTGDTNFLSAAHGAVQLCGRDILDGGVASIPGLEGVFFEDEAIYPAAHTLLAHLEALVGIYDFLDLALHATSSVSDVSALRALAAQGTDTLHALLTYFDTGRWTRANLLYGAPASHAEHALHVAFLAAVSARCGCAQCAETLNRWQSYTRAPRWWLRGARKAHIRHDVVMPSDTRDSSGRLRVCVPITAFPVQGGMRSVVRGFQQTMADEWEMTYLAGSVGAHGPETMIQSFGLRRSIFGPSAMAPSQFPNVWRYFWRGFGALRSQARAKQFAFLLPQDGVFSGAFAAVAGRMAGTRVVVVDHGNVTLPQSAVYRRERERALRAMPAYRRPFEYLRLTLYWPSARLLRAVATRYADHFLAAGEDVAKAWTRDLGVPSWRVTLFPFLVKTHLFAPADHEMRAQRRAAVGVRADALLIMMVNRLAPEKGIDIALDGLSAFLDSVDQETRERVTCLIIGAGPLRGQVTEHIEKLRLNAHCALFGEADESTIAWLLGASDVFLYTGVRAINSMAVLEAMAAGCAVVASTAPEVIARYLEDGRGVAIPPHSPQAVRDALLRLANDDALRKTMGQRARRYVEERHTEDALRGALRRSTMWRSLRARRADRLDSQTRIGVVTDAGRSDLEGTARSDGASK
jgi:glycosyltransferase involved in cell wall biosynthesis